ncbi:ABC transporter permease [Streptomyces lonarensis]|uniref:ABC transporter permease n=1 Tax=Streptomyces lonarensis TaxID=700599 RepID=A0A7X6CXL4_9ACTN|nr:ABC transporter permease [Streptomyces lonarensis]NJQ04432.1 ABC transporter permease [Streptomyces lonarensis]
MSASNCLTANAWICGEYLRTRREELVDATLQHIAITGTAVVLAVLLAFPLALLARRYRRLTGTVLTLTTVVYTIPTLAMYALLLPVFGLSASVVVCGLVLYSLTILVRNMLAGLDGVPEDAREAARGMGFGPGRLLFRVELPLALPALMAGVRIATVSAVSLTTVGAIVGNGGLGNLIYSGMDSLFKAQVLTASVLCVVLAVVADVLLLVLQRALTPWARARDGGGRGRRRGGAPGPGDGGHPPDGGAGAVPPGSGGDTDPLAKPAGDDRPIAAGAPGARQEADR